MTEHLGALKRIDDLLAAAAAHLSRTGVAEGALDARLLLQHLTGLSRSDMVLRGGMVLDETTRMRYWELIAQRGQRIPLHYLTGLREFWSLEFVVSPAVLIPRPETEFLLEQVVSQCADEPVGRALDIGTGSGVIAVVLARELACQVVAIDLSEAALQVARTNFARHDPSRLIDPVCTDLFAAFAMGCIFDLIVSNPPYIADGEIAALEPEVGQAEPRLALSGGADGLRCIERIARDAPACLRPGGWLFMEIGADQSAAVTALFTSPSLPYTAVEVVADWSGRPRVLRARYLPK